MDFVDRAAEAAVRWAAEHGRELGSLSMADIAEAAGVSRSTLLRRAGNRAALDAALERRTGAPVTARDRIVGAAREIIEGEGVDALTLERVAERAGCTVASVYNQVGGREAVLIEVFDRCAVLLDLQPLLDRSAGLAPERLARAVYRALLDTGLDQSTAATRLMLDALARPRSELAEHIRADYLPRGRRAITAALRTVLGPADEVPLDDDVLLALFLGPVQVYLQVALADRRPRGEAERSAAADAFATAFRGAAATFAPGSERP